MIFQYTWPQVISRQKTQTRRVAGMNEVAIRSHHNRIVAVMHNGREKWRVGRTYAVQPGRGRRQIARIRVVRIRSERLSRISQADARAEGFADRREFMRTWERIHGPGSRECRVWVLEFELVAVCVNLEELPRPSAARILPVPQKEMASG